MLKGHSTGGGRGSKQTARKKEAESDTEGQAKGEAKIGRKGQRQIKTETGRAVGKHDSARV